MSDLIKNRVGFVSAALGNRADLNAAISGLPGTPTRIQNWLWQSWLNIGMSYSFPDAEASVQVPWSQAALGSNDYITYPSDCRAIKAITAYRSDGIALQLKYKDIGYIRKYSISSNTVGPPSILCDFQQKIFIRPLPDTSVYTVYIDYWQKPQLLQPVPPTPDYANTAILVPDDWLEVIDMGAMLRGHVSLLEREKAQELQNLLFGFTMPSTGKMVPGLLAQMWTRRQATAPAMDYNIQPSQAKRSYTNVG